MGRAADPHATEAWSVTGKVHAIGHTELNPRVVSNLWALGDKVSPHFVLDMGLARFHPLL